MNSHKEVLNLAVQIGDAMLRNGAEIYRVEDTVKRVIRAFGIEDFDVYVLTNGIFASADETQDDSCSIIRHVPFGSIHLGRLNSINRLTRGICSGKYSVEDATALLEKIATIPFTSSAKQIFFCGLGCGCYAFLFGGTFWDALFAFFIGLILQASTIAFQNYKTSKFVINIFGSAIVTIFALLLHTIHLPVLYDKIIIGCIMPLVPGIALTTSIRDLFNGDYLCGTIRMIDSLLTAGCIAAGVGSVITVYQLILGGLV